MAKDDKRPERKGASLNPLAAALVQAGHLSNARAKELSREVKRERKELGREGAEEREREEQRRAAERREQEARADREREAARAASGDLERVKKAVREGMVARSGGMRRWYFVARDKRILFMDLADGVAKDLAFGRAAIVESLGAVPGEHVVIGDKAAFLTIQAHDEEAVRFWNRSR